MSALVRTAELAPISRNISTSFVVVRILVIGLELVFFVALLILHGAFSGAQSELFIILFNFHHLITLSMNISDMITIDNPWYTAHLAGWYAVASVFDSVAFVARLFTWIQGITDFSVLARAVLSEILAAIALLQLGILFTISRRRPRVPTPFRPPENVDYDVVLPLKSLTRQVLKMLRVMHIAMLWAAAPLFLIVIGGWYVYWDLPLYLSIVAFGPVAALSYATSASAANADALSPPRIVRTRPARLLATAFFGVFLGINAAILGIHIVMMIVDQSKFSTVPIFAFFERTAPWVWLAILILWNIMGVIAAILMGISLRALSRREQNKEWKRKPRKGRDSNGDDDTEISVTGKDERTQREDVGLRRRTPSAKTVLSD